MAAYASQAEFEAYVEGWTTTDAPALGRMLERASDDVDEILGYYDVISTGTWTGRKLDPSTLEYFEDRALTRATCAQAEHRFNMGEEFFARPQYDSVSGPEFSTSGGKLPRVAPKTLQELSGSGLLRNTTSMGRSRRGPSWLSFSHNIEEE